MSYESMIWLGIQKINKILIFPKPKGRSGPRKCNFWWFLLPVWRHFHNFSKSLDFLIFDQNKIKHSWYRWRLREIWFWGIIIVAILFVHSWISEGDINFGAKASLNWFLGRFFSTTPLRSAQRWVKGFSICFKSLSSEVFDTNFHLYL